MIADHKGSISAEHGLGVMKAPYINYSQTEESVEMMRKIKTLFDPKGVMVSYSMKCCPSTSSYFLRQCLTDSDCHFSCNFSCPTESLQVLPLVFDTLYVFICRGSQHVAMEDISYYQARPGTLANLDVIAHRVAKPLCAQSADLLLSCFCFSYTASNISIYHNARSSKHGWHLLREARAIHHSRLRLRAGQGNRKSNRPHWILRQSAR